MVESNKFRALEEHGGQLDERMQFLRQELQDSTADNKRQWQEQAKWNEQLFAQMDTLMASVQIFMVGKEAEKDDRNQTNT